MANDSETMREGEVSEMEAMQEQLRLQADEISDLQAELKRERESAANMREALRIVAEWDEANVMPGAVKAIRAARAALASVEG